MIIAHNGVSWQPTLHQPQRTNDEQAVAQATDFRTAITTAKLKVMLQNLGSGVTGQESTEQLTTSTARQAFQELMSKSHGEMIKEKLLSEIGLTEAQYEALPPEVKAKVGELIAQRLQEEIENQVQEKAQEQLSQADGTSDGNEDAISHV